MSGLVHARFFLKTGLVIAVLVLASHFVGAQGKSERDQFWKPKEGKYYFSQAWVWSFVDEFSDVKGEMTVLVDTLTGTFLLDHDTYRNSDDQADFILAFQDGIYLTASTDENGKKSLKSDTLETTVSSHQAKQYYDEDFKRLTKSTGEYKIYGQNSKKMSGIKGERYKTTFDTPGAFSYDYLKKMNFSLLPIYNFNQRQTRARLPYTFSGALHMNYLLLETSYESDGKKIAIILNNVVPVQKTINLASYGK